MMKTIKHRVLLLTILTILAYICSVIVSPMELQQIRIACFCLLLLFIGFCAVVKVKSIGGAEKLSLTAVVFVFVVGLCFILVLPYNYSSHDLCWYQITETGVWEGHLGYIRWIVERGLPLQNPLTEGNSILYHPPFSYMIYALLIRFDMLFGMTEQVMMESLQVLSLLYGVGFAMAAGLICKELGAKDSTCALATLFSGLTPIVLLTSAVPNNDMITAWLMTLCALFTIRWIKSFKTGDIIGIAITLGLGMASKMNAAIIIPSIALIFVIVFIQKIQQKQIKKTLTQYGLFLLCSVPEAIAWPLFHLICYQLPFHFVRLPGGNQYIGDWLMSLRYGLPKQACINSMFFELDTATNHNVWMQSLKTALFDELTLARQGSLKWSLCTFLIIFFVVLLTVLLISFIMLCTRNIRSLKQGIHKNGLIYLFLAVYAVSGLISYLLFFYNYPYICTANARYIMNLLPILGIGLCLLEKKRWSSIASFAAVAAFSGLVCMVYGIYFLL